MDPLRYATQSIDESDIAAVVKVLRSDWLTQGPEVERFEHALAHYVGARYAVAVNSGTAALHLAMLAVMPRIAPDWDIQTTPLSFVATANAVLMATDPGDAKQGASLRFRDIDAATGNMVGSDAVDVAIPVHFAGRAADLSTMRSTYIIEDACHALGAMDFDGCSRVGSCAHSLATCFSFHAVKPITTGEGGAVTTNDEDFADEVRCLRDHGRRDGLMVSLSGNFRMPDINAALGLSQLARCDEMRERRAYLAMVYNEALAHVTPQTLATWPHAINWPEPWKTRESDAWHLYPVRIKHGRRDEVKAKLNAEGIWAQIHYHPIHLQPYYRERFGYKEGMFPEAEAWGAEELSLPLHAKMIERDIERVVDALRRALA